AAPSHTSNQSDRILLDALTAAAAGQGELFLTAVADSTNTSLASQAATERIAIVAEHVARGESADPRRLLTALAHAQPEIAAASLPALVKRWPRDREVPL